MHPEHLHFIAEIRANRHNRAILDAHAPNGLESLRAGVLTPNPLTPHLPLLRKKAASYRSRWEWLQVVEP